MGSPRKNGRLGDPALPSLSSNSFHVQHFHPKFLESPHTRESEDDDEYDLRRSHSLFLLLTSHILPSLPRPLHVRPDRLTDLARHVALGFRVLRRKPRKIPDKIMEDQNLPVATIP
jgi:hypothetical protein